MEFLFLGSWLICGIGAAMIGQSKRRSGCAWFIAGILLGPIALLIVGFMAPAPEAVEVNKSSSTDFGMKKCPSCAESIRLEAIKCRYCGNEFDPAAVAEQIAARNIEAEKKPAYCHKCNKSDAYIDTYGKYFCPNCNEYMK